MSLNKKKNYDIDKSIEINDLFWDRNKNMAKLNQLMKSQHFPFYNWMANCNTNMSTNNVQL